MRVSLPAEPAATFTVRRPAHVLLAALQEPFSPAPVATAAGSPHVTLTRARRPRPADRYVALDPPELVARFTVDGEPIPKARPRWAPRGGTYTAPRTVRAEAHVIQSCFVQNPRLRPQDGLMGLEVQFHLAGLGRADIDNLLKLVADALNGIAWHDDRQVTRLSAELCLFAEQPRTEVAVWQLAVPG